MRLKSYQSQVGWLAPRTFSKPQSTVCSSWWAVWSPFVPQLLKSWLRCGSEFSTFLIAHGSTFGHVRCQILSLEIQSLYQIHPIQWFSSISSLKTQMSTTLCSNTDLLSKTKNISGPPVWIAEHQVPLVETHNDKCALIQVITWNPLFFFKSNL